MHVMTWAEGGMLSCPQTGGLWFVMAVKYILSQVLPGSHIGLSPGGVSKLVLLKTSSSRASAVESHCLYSCCGPTESQGLGFPFLLALNVHTVGGDAHDLGMAVPSHVCHCP